MGRPKAWDEAAHRRFRELLEHHGDQGLVELKARLRAWIEGGSEPAGFPMPSDKFVRRALKVTLCQIGRGEHAAGTREFLEGGDDPAPASDAYGH